MTENPNNPVSIVPTEPDFDKLSFITANGQIVEYSDVEMIDFASDSATFAPVLRGGQSDEPNGSYQEGKKTFYPNEKLFYIEHTQYSETEDSDKPVKNTTYESLNTAELIFIPLAYDQRRAYWKNPYDADTPSEPDCQSNRYNVAPIPDNVYLSFDANGRPVAGKYAHACMLPVIDAKGQLKGKKEFCPHCKWGSGKDGKGQACVVYALVYGLIIVDNEPRFVEARFKKSSYKAGELLQIHMRKLHLSKQPMYLNPVRLAHGKSDDKKAGYSYQAVIIKENHEPVLTDTLLPNFTEQYADLIAESTELAQKIIAQRREYGARMSDTPVTQEIVEGEIVTPDTPF